MPLFYKWHFKCYCCAAGVLTDAGIDERAMDAIKEFSAEQALEVLDEFKKSNLEHVANKSAFICGVMKTYRQKHRTSSVGGAELGQAGAAANRRPGPDETRIKVIHSVQFNHDAEYRYPRN